MAVIELVRFRVNDGVDEDAFRALNDRFQREVVPTLPGLERREATRAEGGEWLLVLRYADMASAERGPQAWIAMHKPRQQMRAERNLKRGEWVSGSHAILQANFKNSAVTKVARKKGM